MKLIKNTGQIGLPVIRRSIRKNWQAVSAATGSEKSADRSRWFILTGRRRKSLFLDAGTGPGFFAVILAEASYKVTAIDAAPAMLAEAKRNAGPWQEAIDFRLMDAQKPTFTAESFDVVLSRNLTWVLEDPEQTYGNWRHVLKPGGLLLNFDANWYNYLYDADLKQQYEQDRRNVQQNDLEDHYLSTDIDAMEAIALQVPLTGIQRPHWDIRTLEKLRMRSITTDVSVWQRVWSTVEKINYASTPMFMIAAIK